MTAEDQTNNPEVTLKNLLIKDFTSATVTVCLASLGSKDSVPTFQMLQTTNELQERFREIINNFFDRYHRDTSRIIRAYSVGHKPDAHEVQYIELREYEHLQAQVESLSSLADLLPFSNERSFVRNLRFYVLVVQLDGGEMVYGLRWHAPRMKLDRSSSIGAVLHRDRYDLLKGDLLLFDDQIDCVIYGDSVFIFNRDKFEKIFRFYQLIERRADEALSAIQQNISIQNFDKFCEDCKRHPIKLSKLADVADKNYLSKLGLDDVKKVVERNPHLSGVIGQENGQEILSYDPEDPWSLLRLLNDDYLESLMTGESYEVNSKQSVEGS